MQKVIGEVQVAGILLGIPEEIYERTKDFSGIYWEKYRGYFNDRKTAYAFCLGEFHAYTPPKKILKISEYKRHHSFLRTSKKTILLNSKTVFLTQAKL